jgi:FAD/FMN-containing dehydrogenase
MRLERALRDRVDGEVRFDAGARGAYSTDASNFRQVPIGVVLPRTPEAAAEAVAVCREHGAPVLSRGGGTSLAGQCTNTAVVLDWSKYCHRVLSVDPQQRTCTVEPGIVLDQLNGQLAPHGLRFGPEPATHMNCTLGGMIGNNSCGATAQRTGKVVARTTPASSGGVTGGGRSTAGCAGCGTVTLTRSGSATRTSRAGSLGTTSTRCFPSTASTSLGCWWAANPRWSLCCGRNSS